MTENLEIKNQALVFKQANPWLDLFDLSDQQLVDLNILVARVLIATDDLDTFYAKLKNLLNQDDEAVKKIALVIIKNKFLPFAELIGDVAGFVKKIGGTVPQSIEKKSEIQKEVVENNNSNSISFFTEDDKEIEKIKSSIGEPMVNHNYSSLADEIISELGYNDEEYLNIRLKNTIIARLKDIRDDLETTELLKKNKKIGGLEMADDQADKLISIIKDKISSGALTKISTDIESDTALNKKEKVVFPKKSPFEKEKTTIYEKKEKEEAQDKIIPPVKKIEEKEVVRNLNEPLPKINTPSKNNDLSSLPVIKEEDGLPVIMSPQGDELMVLSDKSNKIQSNKNTKQQSEKVEKDFLSQLSEKPKIPEPKKEVKPNQVVAPKPFPQPRPQKLAPISRPVNQTRRPMVDGVKVSPILVGPIEELQTMTLIGFRRLGETPYRAIDKIVEKINLLEKESYAKRLEGINAWHKSEVNKFYRLLGQASMQDEKSVEDIISERIAMGKPTLSIEEFNSVSELNKRLRY